MSILLTVGNVETKSGNPATIEELVWVDEIT